jgi:hypothetical protein
MLAIPASASAIELGVYTPGAPADGEALSEYATMVGRQPDMVMWYRDFGQQLMEAPEVDNLRATGQTPMVTWEPNDVSLVEIAAGAYDAYLHESAEIAKAWGAPLLLRFAHEMNGDWYPWGSGSVSPELYLAAWRHVVSVFRGDGADNVRWVWSPYVLVGGRYPITPYFPGDAWIDYVALDGYNWGGAGGRWQSLESVFSSSYALVTELSAKPLIIAETASSETGGDKAAWIRSGFMSAIPREFPRVAAVVWFDRSQEEDWRVDSSQASLDAYRAVVDCSIYGGDGPCEGGGEGLTVESVRVPNRLGGTVSGAVSFRLSEPARVRIEIALLGAPARRVSVLRASHAGRNRVPLVRILHRRHLSLGRYRVVVSARNGSSRTPRRTAHFRVVEALRAQLGLGERQLSETGRRRPGAAALLRLVPHWL